MSQVVSSTNDRWSSGFEKVATYAISNCDVYGVTQLAGRIFVVCDLSNVIRIYDTELQLLNVSITVAGLQYPSDLVACKSCGPACLYVSDYSDKIWRLVSRPTINKNEEIFYERLFAEIPAFSLSVSVDSRLLVIGKDLTVYNPFTGFIDVTNLATFGIQKARHALKTSSGRLILCLDTGPVEVDSLRLGKAYGNFNQTSRNRRKTEFSYLALGGRNEELLLAADVENRRVVQFEIGSGRQRDLLSTEGGIQPQRLNFELDTGILVVGMTGSRIDLYRLK